ncbi:MAG: FAD-dependent monooxygenase, partial [Alphaproteobacteria bacterium]|nr:FAD-dependent monooxygenase [Alphaproteobacteria bacterium]
GVVEPVARARSLDAGFDGRVTALSYASVRMLRTLAIWPHLQDDAQPILDILVTDAAAGRPPSPLSLHFDAGEIGEPMGYIVENRHIRAALFAVADKVPGLELLSPLAVERANPAAEHIDASLSDGGTVQARLLVAADGRESRLREEIGIAIIGWSYPQWGIVATVAHERAHHGTAYEHFLPSGPFAILPMTGNRSSLVWTERADLAPHYMNLPADEFDAEVARRFGAHLGATTVIGPRWSYPLKFHLARDYVKPRFALVGDAAHGIHPIAGQGFNLGLKDVAALAECVLDGARLGLDIGSLDILKRYERWRRFDATLMGMTMDAFNRIFSNDIAPLRAVRDLGMGLVDQIGPLRRFLMRNAGGTVGKLPRLLRGDAA